ncbi:hypothetical protein U0070_002364 [Myodes glareolus]|uniref:Uncharacterized protein n=1 Tax=Myodes glareolus TaxID=447135 RepID=A0AAW0IXS7_MYOGA
MDILQCDHRASFSCRAMQSSRSSSTIAGQFLNITAHDLDSIGRATDVGYRCHFHPIRDHIPSSLYDTKHSVNGNCRTMKRRGRSSRRECARRRQRRANPRPCHRAHMAIHPTESRLFHGLIRKTQIQHSVGPRTPESPSSPTATTPGQTSPRLPRGDSDACAPMSRVQQAAAVNSSGPYPPILELPDLSGS